MIRHDLIVVSLRGTRPLYVSDWAIDFNASRVTIHTKDLWARMHVGFLTTALEFVEGLAAKLHERVKSFNGSPPIYLTGHSLGGALAATISALDCTTFFTKFRLGTNVAYRLPVHSSYTFGMPRYGDENAVEQLAGPFHTFNRHDLVPSLPPRWLGFADSPHEFLVGDSTVQQVAQRESHGLSVWLQRTLELRGVRYHFVERYIQQLAKAL